MLPRKQDALKPVTYVPDGLTPVCLRLNDSILHSCGPFISIDEPILIRHY